MSVSSTTFEQFRDNPKGVRHGINIRKRPAVTLRPVDKHAPCELAMKYGNQIVVVTTTATVTALEWGMDRCAAIRDLAAAVEPSLRYP